MKSIETYKLGVVLEVDGKKGLATIELSDKALQKLGVQAQKSSKSFSGALSDIGANLANIKAGLDIARDVGGFLFGMAKGAADAGAKYHDLSVQTGVYVETLSGLDSQLKQSGTDADAFARSTVFMQKSLGEAAAGNKELRRTFAALGIKDVRAALADTDGTIRTVVKSLGSMESAGERNAAGTKVLGKGFKDLSVFIADTGGNLDEVVERARRSGEVMTDEAAAAADEFGDQLDALSHAATVAARNFGMEFVPEITSGMAETTGALRENANRWREWGSEVADVLRGLRQVYDSEFGQGFRQSVGWLWELNARTNPLIQGYRALRGLGGQARERERQAQINDPATAVRAVVEINTAQMLAHAKQWMGVPKRADTSDLFSPGSTKRPELESAQKRFVETLHDWADAFGIPRAQLRELGSRSKVHRGKGHRSGLAVDISPQYMTPQAVEAARQMGLKVLPELYTGHGPYGYSTGPHYHVEAMGKAAQVASKQFEEQNHILDSLARKIAEAEVGVRAFTQTSIEQELASARMSLGLQKLEGPAADLAESMMADYEAQLKARDAGRLHAEALDALKAVISSTSAEVFGAVSAQDQMAAALRRAEVPLDSYRGKWAMLLATMKDVGDLAPLIGAMPAAIDIPLGEGPVVKDDGTAPPPVPHPSKVQQVWKELTTLGDETRRLQFTFQQLAQSLQQQQQVGQKRGFFSKLLGFASPFLSLIPGVGPILSLGARVASSALAGDYLGAAVGAAGGFAPGGAFRSRPAAPSAGTGTTEGTPIPGAAGLPPRALGGPVRKGRAYLVGELRPEVFEPEEDGYVHRSEEAYARSRGGGTSLGDVRAGSFAAMIQRLVDRIESVPMDHVLTVGSRSAQGQAAIAHGWQAGAARNPKVIEWMNRRVAA